MKPQLSNEERLVIYWKALNFEFIKGSYGMNSEEAHNQARETNYFPISESKCVIWNADCGYMILFSSGSVITNLIEAGSL